jgi:hypothetical protein
MERFDDGSVPALQRSGLELVSWALHRGVRLVQKRWWVEKEGLEIFWKCKVCWLQRYSIAYPCDIVGYDWDSDLFYVHIFDMERNELSYLSLVHQLELHETVLMNSKIIGDCYLRRFPPFRTPKPLVNKYIRGPCFIFGCHFVRYSICQRELTKQVPRVKCSIW